MGWWKDGGEGGRERERERGWVGRWVAVCGGVRVLPHGPVRDHPSPHLLLPAPGAVCVSARDRMSQAERERERERHTQNIYHDAHSFLLEVQKDREREIISVTSPIALPRGREDHLRTYMCACMSVCVCV